MWGDRSVALPEILKGRGTIPHEIRAPVQEQPTTPAATPTTQPQHTPGEKVPVATSEYEMQRKANIRANQEALFALGLHDAVKAVHEETARSKAQLDPAVRAARLEERRERMAKAHANKRSSPRLASLGEGGNI